MRPCLKKQATEEDTVNSLLGLSSEPRSLIEIHQLDLNLAGRQQRGHLNWFRKVSELTEHGVSGNQDEGPFLGV